MENSIFQFTIALIGCITGISGLILHFYRYLLTRPRLKVSLDPFNASYVFKASDFKVKGFKTNICSAVSIKITNQSSYPVTIDRIEAKFRNKTTFHFTDFTFKAMEFRSGSVYTLYNPSERLQLPSRLDSFDVISGSARFPFCDFLENVDFQQHNPIKMKIIIHTPRGRVRLQVRLYEYHSYHEGFRPVEVSPFSLSRVLRRS